MSEQKTITVTSPLLPNLQDFEAYLEDIFNRKWLTNNGHYHQQLEKALADYLGVPYLSLFTNGTLPLITALQALRITGEVITTPYSFVATTHSIWWNNLKPVFVDVREEDGNIDPEKIEAAITPKTTAIMPVHVYGTPCDTKRIQEIADIYGLKVIYDAAHTFAETYKGKSTACFGDASCFSFHATKVFNSIEGGAVCYSDKRLGEAIYELKNFGIRGPEEIVSVGANAKMNEFCAAMGICNLRHIDSEIAKRKAVYERYFERLGSVDGLKLNAVQEHVKPNYAYFPVVIEEKLFGASRAEVFSRLAENGIFARKYFYPLTNTFTAFHGQFNVLETPQALHISRRVMTLPMYADLGLDVIDRICDVILGCKN